MKFLYDMSSRFRSAFQEKADSVSEKPFEDTRDVTLIQSVDLTDVHTKGQKRSAHYPPAGYYVSYVEGLEKTLLAAIKNEINESVDFFGWDRRFVQYRVAPVSEDHPYLKPGYVYEIIYKGDGFSYIEQIIELFRDKNNRNVAVELTSDSGLSMVYFDTTGTPIVTEWWKSVTRSSEQLSHLENVNYVDCNKNTVRTSTFYSEGYIWFYLSQILFGLGMVSIFLAAMFKYVWIDQSKTMIDENYYTENKHIPIKTLRDVLNPSSASESQRVRAVRFSSNKGWYVVLERTNEDGEKIRLEQKVSRKGDLLEATQIDKPESMLSLGIPEDVKEVKTPEKTKKKVAEKSQKKTEKPADKKE